MIVCVCVCLVGSSFDDGKMVWFIYLEMHQPPPLLLLSTLNSSNIRHKSYVFWSQKVLLLLFRRGNSLLCHSCRQVNHAPTSDKSADTLSDIVECISEYLGTQMMTFRVANFQVCALSMQVGRHIHMCI